MQKGNERKNVALLGFLKDLAGRMGNEAFECRLLARSRNGPHVGGNPGGHPGSAARVEATKEINYLREHQNWMDYPMPL
jgi:hypothetical protein